MRKSVAILGATGVVGQRFIQLLSKHPWFSIEVLAASEKSVGKKYEEAVHWIVSSDIPEGVKDIKIESVSPSAIKNADIVFSALPSSIAGPIEEEFAKRGFIVFSNASAHRMDSDVPLLNPEVNWSHLELLEEQRKRWSGAIITNPNCSAAILTLSLKPIHDKFGIKRVVVVTMQALSGAGYPGVSSLDIIDNIIPYIKEEEEKICVETKKILGKPKSYAKLDITASCNRVPTRDGHLESVFIELEAQASVDEVIKVLDNFTAEPQRLNLPTAPKKPIVVRKELDRPQPCYDRLEGGGMSVVVGRVREDNVMRGIKYTVLGHNTIRGAAGCSILNAEIAIAKGFI